MRIIKLDKNVLRVSGNAEKFLNGLTSNTLDRPFNAFLNMHGRIVATFEHVKVAEDEYLIVVASKAVESLLNHIGRFAKLNKTVIERTELIVYFDLRGDAILSSGDKVIKLPKGQMILSERAVQDTVSDEEFKLFRLNERIPLHTIDFQTDEMVLNVHEYDYVSYSKGCFLGQEPVAKVHNRATPTWKLAVKYQDDCLPHELEKMTSYVFDPVAQKGKGFVMEKAGNSGRLG